jgi:serine/threonine-protein kinase
VTGVDVDARADVWAIGVMLYECLSGQRPFEGENAGQILKAIIRSKPLPLDDVVPGTPQDLRDLVAYMISADREQRMTDLREAHAVLRRFATILAPSFASAKSPTYSLPPSDSNPGVRSGNRFRSGPISIEDAETERAFDTPPPRSNRAGLDTTDALEKPTWSKPSSGRRGWLVAGAVAVVSGVVVWQVASTRVPEPLPAPARPAAEPTPAPTAAADPTVAPEPTATATAASSASSRPRGGAHRTGDEPPPAPPAPRPTLPHGIDEKAPF